MTEEEPDMQGAYCHAGYTVGYNAAELQHMQFMPIRYAVEGYIPEGVTIFAGRPKIGKSWACIDIAVAIATGANAFGNIPCEQGDVLYLALEDNPRRLQSRMHRMYGDSPWPTRLRFENQWPRLDAGAVEKIRTWVNNSEKPSLIIIDTLAKIRGSRSEKDSAYESDYRAISDLQVLAGEIGLAILLVHHVRKMEADDPLDTVSGTLGLTGAADTILVLDRKSAGVTLYGRGRDIEEVEAALSFDKHSCKWSILGVATEVRRSDERTTILEHLEDINEPLSPTEVADLMGAPRDAVRKMLTRMAAAGEIKKMSRGAYTHNGYVKPVTSVTKSQGGPTNSDNVTDVTWVTSSGEGMYGA